MWFKDYVDESWPRYIRHTHRRESDLAHMYSLGLRDVFNFLNTYLNQVCAQHCFWCHLLFLFVFINFKAQIIFINKGLESVRGQLSPRFFEGQAINFDPIPPYFWPQITHIMKFLQNAGIRWKKVIIKFFCWTQILMQKKWPDRKRSTMFCKTCELEFHTEALKKFQIS